MGVFVIAGSVLAGCRGSDGSDGEAVGGELGASTTGATATGATDADENGDENGAVNSGASTGVTPPVNSPTSSTGGAAPEPATCRGPGYALVVPDGWFHFECRYLSDAPVTVSPDTCDCQFPIDLAVAGERYDTAVDRISSSADWTIESASALTVDGRTATGLDTLVEVDGRTVERRLVVIDLDGSTMFLAATDRADQATSDLPYQDALDALDDVVASLALS